MPTDRIGSLDTARIAKIMTVALEEFARHSFHQASYNRIIRKCGMSKGTMYYYFRSKEDLFMTLLHATTKEFGNLVRNLGQPTSASQFWTESQKIVSLLFKKFQEKPILGQFLQGFLTAESRRDSSPSLQTIHQIDDWLQDFILTGQLLGAIRRDLPIELIIGLLWGIWDTFTHWLKDATRGYEADELSGLLTDLWQRSLAHEPQIAQAPALTPISKQNRM
ncbi:MAG: TetR/AcrR family transcriptional regulator [Oligoflexus sp.]